MQNDPHHGADSFTGKSRQSTLRCNIERIIAEVVWIEQMPLIRLHRNDTCFIFHTPSTRNDNPSNRVLSKDNIKTGSAYIRSSSLQQIRHIEVPFHPDTMNRTVVQVCKYFHKANRNRSASELHNCVNNCSPECVYCNDDGTTAGRRKGERN